MSKTHLKKALAALNTDQLTDIILECYSANKEFKEYFEYFLNPDPQALYDRCAEGIKHEIKRTKYGKRSKARSGTVKRIIKKFISFHPGYDFIEDIYLLTILYALITEAFNYFNPSQLKGFASIATESLKWADKNSVFAEYIERLTTALDNIESTPYFKGLIIENIQNYINKK